jgi:transposase
MPEVDPPKLNLDKEAILRPGRKGPFLLWHNGRWGYIGGMGRHVTAARQRLLTSRWSRQENYRHAGSSTKGHGRDRAIMAVDKLSQGWKNFVKTVNHGVTSAVVKRCVQMGVGTLVYLQPVADKRDARFLSYAGKIQGRRDATGWDWFQVSSMLSYKCAEAGINLVVRKCGDAKPEKAADKAVRTVPASSAGKGKGRGRKPAKVV